MQVSEYYHLSINSFILTAPLFPCLICLFSIFGILECNGSDQICEYYFETIQDLNKHLSLNYCPVSRNYKAQIIVQF